MTPKDLKNRLLEIIGILDVMPDDVEVIQAMAVVKPVGQGHILIHEGLDSVAASLGMLLSWLQEGKDLSATTKGVKDETTDN